MKHILNPDEQPEALYSIFTNMRNGNTILFLGSGASVGEKRYMSSQLIDYYELEIGRQIGERDITKWIDILSADPAFKRRNFDDFVFKILSKLNVSEAHKILATIPWNEIITTNYDLLVEQAYDSLSSSSNKMYELRTIKSLKQLNYRESNSEVKYIKLNGCMSDRSLYPFAFSSADFSRLKPFYRNVINELKNISPDINFLTIGYSYSDAFASELLGKFDSFNFRDKKWMINIDPHPNENALPYYEQNRICVIKLSFEDFFLKYKEWEKGQDESIVRRKGLTIYDSRNQYVSFSPRLLLNLDGVVKQLSSATSNKERFINEVEFYRGEEPNFSVITRGIDVVKEKNLKLSKQKIIHCIEQNHSDILPIFFLTGDFGIGKSTFCLRLIYELSKDQQDDFVAFEIVDSTKLKKEYLLDLILNCKSKNVILFFDEVEIESNFKSLLGMQKDLSIEQIQGVNVLFLAPIRQNILERFKLSRGLIRAIELKIEGRFEEIEINELLGRLKQAGLVNYIDESERRLLVRKVQRDYDSDSFISLMAIITSGKHESDLLHSYSQLSKEAKNAFLLTALLHRYKLFMPASLLKQNTSMTWDDFIEKVVKAEGKGLLIQEEKPSQGAQPGLYFRTKHPIIAEKLVNQILPSKDRQFYYYEKILRSVEPGEKITYLVNDLLKEFIKGEIFNSSQINRLFEACYTKLQDDPYFLLNYSINLQHRGGILNLKRALDILLYAESLLEYRNHKFIHRRGLLSFELAKLYSEDVNEHYNRDFYLNEAYDLFLTKQLIDAFSSYSYVDFVKMLVWEIKNLDLERSEIVVRQILIEELLEVSNRLVVGNLDRIHGLSSEYASLLSSISERDDYKEYLENMYNDFHLKPYACILLYNHFHINNNFEECDRLVDEMEYYQANFEVVKFLFKYYGQRLYDPNIRIKLLRISRENRDLEKENPLRFCFFNFIAETYNRHFSEGRGYLADILSHGYSLNPSYHEVWLDPFGQEQQFGGVIIKRSNKDRFKSVKIFEMQQVVRLKKGIYDKLVEGTKVNVILHFYLHGLIAEVIQQSDLQGIDSNDEG